MDTKRESETNVEERESKRTKTEEATKGTQNSVGDRGDCIGDSKSFEIVLEIARS